MYFRKGAKDMTFEKENAIKEMNEPFLQYLGSSKASSAGTTTIPAKVRQKTGMLPEDELHYFINEEGDIVIKNISKRDLINLGTDYVVREFDKILKNDERVFFYYGNAMPYYGPAIMAAYIQFNEGKFNNGMIELTENGEKLYGEFIENKLEDHVRRNFRPEDRKFYNELLRYKSNEAASLYIINAMSNSEDIKEIPKILKGSNAKVLVLSINNHYESDLQRVVDKYLHIQYDSRNPIVVSAIDVKKGTQEKLLV